MKKIIEHWNQLVDKDEPIKSVSKRTTLPITPPKYLTHCTMMTHLGSILENEQFGGTDVLSGNVYGKFDKTHLSPIPVMYYGSYNICLVLDTDEFPKDSFEPTYYGEYNNEKDCFIFNDEGWQRVSKRKTQSCYPAHHEEHEWNVKNPYKVPLKHISNIIFRDDQFGDKDARYRIENMLVRIGMAKKMTLAELNRFVGKAHIVKYDHKTKKFEYNQPILDEPIKTVAICERISSQPMINATIYEELKGMSSKCKKLDALGFHEQ